MRIESCFILLCIFNISSFVRADEKWSYDRLFKEADLVVIASAKGTVDTDDKLKLKDQKVELSGQETHFAIHATLKGKLKAERIRVLHYSLPAGVVRANGPNLVSFRKEASFLGGDGIRGVLSRPEYILFLRVMQDGRYEPVSGQLQPAISVRELYGYEGMFQFADKKDK